MTAVAVLFLIGVLTVHFLPSLPEPGWLALPLLLLSRALLEPRWVWISAPVIGFVWTCGHAIALVGDRLDPRLEGRDLELVGVIDSVPAVSGGQQRFVFAPDDPEMPARVRLTWYQTEVLLEPGQRWSLWVRLRRPRGFANPGGLDYERHLLYHGIGAVGYVRQSSHNQPQGGPRDSRGLLLLRANVAERLSRSVPDSSATGLLVGLAVGLRDRISSEQWGVLSATGTTHLMAISGLHVGLVAGMFFWLARWVFGLFPGLLGSRSTYDAAGWAAMLAAVAYALLAGFAVPTQRALLMLCVVMYGLIARRRVTPPRGLSLALLAVLIHDPMGPLSAGFWLSFAAVACIAFTIVGRIEASGPIRRFWRVQWAVFFGLAPLLLVSFEQVSLVAPFANGLLIPLFSLLVVPLVLLAVLLLPIAPTAGNWAIRVASEILEHVWPVLEWLAGSPYATWFVSPPVIWVVVAAVGALLFLTPSGVPGRGLGLVLLASVILWRPPALSAGAVELTLLDVGQGLAAVVRTRGHVMVYDGGPAFKSGADTGDLVVGPYLRHLGIREIDLMLVSHGDTDHMGGVQSIVRSFDPKRILLGPSVDQTALGGERCVKGQVWRWDSVRFEILHPDRNAQWLDNDSSCVLKVTGVFGSVLLPGDIESRAELVLLTRHDELGSDVIIVPHHGSSTSSQPAFVGAVRPRYALVSAGHRNRWGFPKPEVVERWETGGARVLSTPLSGAITVLLSADGDSRIERHRASRRRYWRADEQ